MNKVLSRAKQEARTGVDEVQMGCASDPPPATSVLDLQMHLQAGLIHRQHLQRSLSLQHPSTRISNLRMQREWDLTGYNKVFAAAWLDSEQVLLGTKCYQLLCANVRTGKFTQIQLPAPVQALPEPSLSAALDDPMAAWHWIMLRDAGIRTLTLNGNKDFLLLGGRNPYEATILNTNDLAGAPRHTLLGHTDWIFAGCWMNRDVAATASRDGTVKLWSTATSVQQCPPLHTLLVSTQQVGVRDVVCGTTPGSDLITLTTKGVVQAWDTTTMQQRHKETLRQAAEPVCLTTADGITAAGLLTRIALLDIRQRRPIGKITGMRSGNGVRSLQIAGSLLSAGYCNGQVTFHDLRTLQSLWPTCMFRDKPEVVANLQAPKGWAQSTWDGESHACLTHQWDGSGTRLLMAGGPIRPTTKGCFACVW